MSVLVTFIRHGKTAGNLRGAYIGKTDVPLCPEGAAALREGWRTAFTRPNRGFCLQARSPAAARRRPSSTPAQSRAPSRTSGRRISGNSRGNPTPT